MPQQPTCECNISFPGRGYKLSQIRPYSLHLFRVLQPSTTTPCWHLMPYIARNQSTFGRSPQPHQNAKLMLTTCRPNQQSTHQAKYPTPAWHEKTPQTLNPKAQTSKPQRHRWRYFVARERLLRCFNFSASSASFRPGWIGFGRVALRCRNQYW